MGKKKNTPTAHESPKRFRVTQTFALLSLRRVCPEQPLTSMSWPFRMTPWGQVAPEWHGFARIRHPRPRLMPGAAFPQSGIWPSRPHANIDFIFALYQAFKPDVALEDGQFMDGTFLVPPSMDDNYVGSFSDMSPFYKNPSRRKNFYKVFFPSLLLSSSFNPYPSRAAATSHPFKPSIPPCHYLLLPA